MSGITLVSAFSGTSWAQAQDSTVIDAVQSDAYALIDLIEEQFAYADRFPDGVIPVRNELEFRISELRSRRDLIAFSQRAFHTLYDHHSITGSGLSDAYGLVPSFADLWVEKVSGGYEIKDVRRGSPAAAAGVRPGCLLESVDGQIIDNAIANFIGSTNGHVTQERLSYVARVLATGRRDQIRRLGLSCDGVSWGLELPNLYQSRLKRDAGLLSIEYRIGQNGATIAVIRFNDSLGLSQTIEAFDKALSEVRNVSGIVIDLRDTASGGNTLIARGILSRFINRREVYQRHILPHDMDNYGVQRSWLEEVTPRGDMVELPLAVVSGRWTGSMGEGLTVAFDALGVPTFGSKMAGLLGGITDHRLPETNVLVKLTTERLEHVDGTPRELFEPRFTYTYADFLDASGQDVPLQAAIENVAGRSFQ